MSKNYIKVGERSKPCEVCGKDFNYLKSYAKYCSQDCRNKGNYDFDKNKNFRRSSVENSLLSIMWGARARAKRKGMECTITDSDILNLLLKQEGKCAATGIIMKPSKQEGHKGKDPYTISIDRIDSTKGYIEGNIQLVCIVFNEFKNSYSLDIVTEVCKNYIKYNEISGE